MLTPKNRLADILTKGSFTRDEWNHLLQLLNIMNFSMCSCSHFLSHRKHSVMSKREQDRTSKEGPAVAKPKPMSLVARSLLSSKKDPPQIVSASNDPGNSKMDESSTSAGIGKPLRGSDSNPKSQSQEWQNDNTQSASQGKPRRGEEASSSAGIRKRIAKGDNTQTQRPRLESQNLTITIHRYFEKVFKNLQIDSSPRIHRLVH